MKLDGLKAAFLSEVTTEPREPIGLWIREPNTLPTNTPADYPLPYTKNPSVAQVIHWIRPWLLQGRLFVDSCGSALCQHPGVLLLCGI